MNPTWLEQGEHLTIIVSAASPVLATLAVWFLSRWFVRLRDFSKHQRQVALTFDRHWEAIEHGRNLQTQSDLKHHALLHEIKTLSASIQEHSQATKENTKKTQELSEKIAVLDDRAHRY